MDLYGVSGGNIQKMSEGVGRMLQNGNGGEVSARQKERPA